MKSGILSIMMNATSHMATAESYELTVPVILFNLTAKTILCARSGL
jgi:hypothetical protein